MISRILSVSKHVTMDHMAATSSTMLMPVVCGDFMADAGQYGPSLGEEAPNWTPNNLHMMTTVCIKFSFTYLRGSGNISKICFVGEDAEASLGVGGSQFPFTLDVSSAEGADIVFVYDSSTSTVADSLNLVAPLFLSAPTLSTSLGDRALTPYLPSDMGDCWSNRNISFWGGFGGFITTPDRVDGLDNLAGDEDGDGIASISYEFADPGPYGGFALLLWDRDTDTLYDRLGQETVYDWGTMKYTFFPIPMPAEGETTEVKFVFDWRDHMAATSTMLMPVLCGDFMAEAGYFSPSLGQELANWNSENLMGWMKDYSDSSTFTVFLHVPQGQWQYKVAASSTVVDSDGDGILELELSLPSGTYEFVVEDGASGELYNAMGASVGLELDAALDMRGFEVTGGGGEREQVTLFLDLRDHVYEASKNVMPVLCSDFMETAGHYGASVEAGAANWNPDNLIGWMKNYNGHGSNYHAFLHVPEGQWHYKVCFRGQPLSSGHGFGGDLSIPIPLTVPTGGADVAFVYNSRWNLVSDSVNGLPILTCSVECGPHGTCVAEQCQQCDPGFVGALCDLETHFNPV